MAVIPPSPKGVRGLIPSAFIDLLPLVKLVLSLSKEGGRGDSSIKDESYRKTPGQDKYLYARVL
jgi:hypothetical protein